MIEIFQNIVALSIQIGILIGIVLLLGYFTKKKYMAVGRYFLWLVLAVRLLIPINMGWVNIEELKQGMEDFFVSGTEEQNTEKTADKNLSNTKKNALKETKTKEKKLTSQSATKLQEEDKTLEQNQVSEGVVREDKNTVWIVLSMIWILGILVMAGYEVVMYQSVYKSIQRWKMPVPKEYRQIFAQVCKEMYVVKEIPVYQCAKAASPMIVGIFKPSVILPDREYEKESLYYIYRHELTHFCHRDLYYKLLQTTVRCIYWFHPLVHAMYQQAAFDVELVCDEKVTKNQSETFCREYSLVLLDTLAAQNQRRVPISTCFFQGGKKQMKERFVRIMSQNKKKYGIGLFGLLIACALVLGNVSLHPKAKQDVSKTKEKISSEKKIFEASSLLEEDNMMFYLGRDSGYNEGRGSRTDFKKDIEEKYPGGEERKTEYGSYVMYDTDTNVRLYLFYNKNYSEENLCGFPIIMNHTHSYKEFQNIKVGDDISEIEKIDSITSYYKKRFGLAPDDLFEVYSNKNADGMSIHLLSDGILKIKYERKGQSYTIREMHYYDDFEMDCLTGTYSFQIDKNDYITKEMQVKDRQTEEKGAEDIIDKRVEALHPVVVDGEKNVIETQGNLDNIEYGIFGDIDTLSETAEEIVGGTIQAVTYDEIEGLAWMKVDVLITDSLKGNLKQNEMISIYMLGGYISLEEYMKYHDDKMPYNMTKQEIKKTVMKEVVKGEAFPQKGEKNIFYLSKTSSDSPLPSDAYERIWGKYAQLDVIKEHETVRGCIPGDDGATIENYTWKEIKRKAK